VIGTVQRDLHDIGKNLVGMMLEDAGFKVINIFTRDNKDALNIGLAFKFVKPPLHIYPTKKPPSNWVIFIYLSCKGGLHMLLFTCFQNTMLD